MMIISTPFSQHIGKPIADVFGVSHICLPIDYYADGEIKVVPLSFSVYGEDILYVWSPPQICEEHQIINVHTSLFEMLFVLDAFERGKAKRVTILVTYLPYLRQDKVNIMPDEGIKPLHVLKRVREMFPSSSFYVVDSHTDVSFLGMKAIDLSDFYGQWILNHYQKDDGEMTNLLLVAPDQGRAEVVQKVAAFLSCDFILCDKKREVEGHITISCTVSVPVQDYRCLVMDDMIDSGKTVMSVNDFLLQNGARHIDALITHNLFGCSEFMGFSGDLFVTDSLYHSRQAETSSKTVKTSQKVIELGHYLGTVMCDILLRNSTH